MNSILEQMLNQGLSFYELCDCHKDNFREQIRDMHGLEYDEIDKLWERYAVLVKERNYEIDQIIQENIDLECKLAEFRQKVWERTLGSKK